MLISISVPVSYGLHFKQVLFYYKSTGPSTSLSLSLFYSILFCSVLFCSVLFYSILFCSVLFSSILFCSIPRAGVTYMLIHRYIDT
ncbi:hypothetical protein BDF14DRAFT_512700 [Spinellus fusiger]|nr:hypothetical protein BDF14DRAFT_512700 [Spinellus fusiger]